MRAVNLARRDVLTILRLPKIRIAIQFYLRVENFSPEVILENRLAEVMAQVQPSSMADMLRGFVDRVASLEPTPGGGSVAALAGALAAGLGQMAIRITKEKKNFQQYAARYVEALGRLSGHSSDLLGLVDADSEA